MATAATIKNACVNQRGLSENIVCQLITALKQSIRILSISICYTDIRLWQKLHLTLDEGTGEILAAVVSASD